MNKSLKKLILIGVVLLIAILVANQAISFKVIPGNMLGIKETWAAGVETNVYGPGFQWLVPAWSQKFFLYDTTSRLFVMNNNTNEETATGRATDAYKVQSQEGQDMLISLNVRWHIDPNLLVSIHKTVHGDTPDNNAIEEKMLRPIVMRVVKDEATRMKALDAYSGEGLVTLQNNIQKSLEGIGDDPAGKELPQRGVVVENFVIEHIGLDPNYIAEIQGKQVAVQRQLRAVEEQKASEAEALVAKAKAQADANIQIVAAERAKQVVILQAEASNQQAIIAADAERQKRVLEAEGQRDGDIARAKGIVAVGEATAKANQLLLQSYSVQGSELYTRIQVAKSVSTAFENVKGYLPTVNSINLLGSNFQDLVDKLAGQGAAPVAAPAPAAAQ